MVELNSQSSTPLLVCLTFSLESELPKAPPKPAEDACKRMDVTKSTETTICAIEIIVFIPLFYRQNW